MQRNFNKPKPRDYKSEYESYQGTPQAKKDRAQRNKARRMMIKAGKAKKGDGKDVGHVKAMGKGGKSVMSNLQVQDRSANRSFARGKKSNMLSETSKREKR